MPRTARFTRDDWAAAALAVLSESGPAAVAVEPVAARLGASKSSFYWLFENRAALLEAALRRWEQRQTDAVLPGLAAIADPAQRLRTLARNAFAATDIADLSLQLLTESADRARAPRRTGQAPCDRDVLGLPGHHGAAPGRCRSLRQRGLHHQPAGRTRCGAKA
jgi:AcrR family transcriptional regulator